MVADSETNPIRAHVRRRAVWSEFGQNRTKKADRDTLLHLPVNYNSWGYASFDYDAVNRKTTVIAQDGSVTTTSYLNNPTTVTDPAGNSRKSQTDSLGRLIAVWENPNGVNYETDYAYDTLDDLTCVVQKGTDATPFTTCAAAPATWRPRTFAYDSLSRLIASNNPETGSVSYTYDNDGNLLTMIAPKPNQTGTATVTTTYTYDVLNRLTQKSYNDGTTSTVKYGYDGTALTGCTTTPPTLSPAMRIQSPPAVPCAMDRALAARGASLDS